MIKMRDVWWKVWLIISIVNQLSVYGNNNFSFKHYNINNGLSHNTVQSILQDRMGFMWFSTKDGLNRFDGTTFKVFKFSPDGELRSNVFHQLLEDKEGNIWVATEGGIYVYDPRQEKFDKFDLVFDDGSGVDGWISDFVQDHDGDLWISIQKEGVFHYDMDEDEFTFYPVSTLPGGLRMISLCVGNNNEIWVFPYGQPMVRIEKEMEQMVEFSLSDDPGLLYNLGEVHNAIAVENDQLIIPTSNKGLISINTANRTHQVLLDEDAQGKPVFARTVTRIDNQTFWIGSESGLYILNTFEGSVVNLRHDNLIPTSISDNAIYSIYPDRDGGIWIGSYFGGVDYYSKENSKFELFYPIPHVNSMYGSRVREFHSASDGKIWIGTEDNGLHLFDPENDVFLNLPDELQSLYSNIHALLVDGDYFWISTYSKGLNRYHLKTGELKSYLKADSTHSISQNSVFAMCKDQRGQIWIGTLSGLNVYNYDKDDLTPVDNLKHGGIHDIFEDSEGDIWVATFSDGLYRLQDSGSEWLHYQHDPHDSHSLSYNTVTSIFEDSEKRLWITTQGGGVSLFNRAQETFITYNTGNGLPNDVVYQIKEDDDGYLWLSTNLGLVRFNHKNNSFSNYTVENGLKTNQFNYKSSYKSENGTLYFGSIDGFVRFNPSTFRKPTLTEPVEVVFTELFINNSAVSPRDEKPLLGQSILFTDKLTLPYHKNSFRLSYAMLNYSNRSELKVSYKLEGFDSEWIHPETNRDIIYSNLNPGKYTLLMTLSNGTMDGNEVETMKTLAIHIRPPFWLSKWAYLLYLLLFAAGMLALFRFQNYRNQIVHKERMRSFEQDKERELYRSKIDFFTNVAHEIRTPLSLIKAPLEQVIMTEEVSVSMKENLQIMSKNTDRLLNLTNQLLDFRKTESDAYALNLSRHNVSELLRETHLRFIPLARKRGVIFELDLPEEEIHLLIDKEAFLKIVSNLLNNAIKYCDTSVHVRAYLSGESVNSWFHLITMNDGETIPVSYKEEIFKPFVHIDKQREVKTAGTGIGLALSKSLTELHKGSLILEDECEENRGQICFHLKLPIGNPENLLVIDEELPVQEEEATTTKEGNLYTILLVDDDKELLSFEERFLSSHYRIKTAENGFQAFEVLRAENINLIVSDIMMPEMDGLELTKRVKLDVEFSHIPVILLTAKVNVESKVLGFETGADAYIDKPFSLEVLLAQIANLLENREILRKTFLNNPFVGASSVARTKSDEEFVKKLYNIVHENLDNSAFVVEDIAEQFNMSRASFYRKIKGVLDLSPNEYIRVERLKKAAQLLRERVYKVNEICYMVGFNSPSYFTKCFQQQFGVLPKDFEKETL